MPQARSFLIEALCFDAKRESCSQVYDVERIHASAATLRFRQSDSIRSDPALGSSAREVAASLGLEFSWHLPAASQASAAPTIRIRRPTATGRSSIPRS